MGCNECVCCGFESRTSSCADTDLKKGSGDQPRCYQSTLDTNLGNTLLNPSLINGKCIGNYTLVVRCFNKMLETPFCLLQSCSRLVSAVSFPTFGPL